MKEGRALKQGNELSWPQVVMAANAPMMTKAALVDGRTDVGVLPTGQVVGEIGELPTVAELIGRVIDEADRRARRGSGPPHRREAAAAGRRSTAGASSTEPRSNAPLPRPARI